MILHFWLAYDHPFIDGNGRTARALFYWSMLKHGFWMFEFISISHAIVKSPIAYGMSFMYCETDYNDLTYFIMYHSAIVRKAISELNTYIGDRSLKLKQLESELRGMVRFNYRQRELIGHAVRHPGRYYTIESHRASHNVSRQTASNDLMELEEKKLFRKSRDGRAFTFIATENMEQILMEL